MPLAGIEPPVQSYASYEATARYYYQKLKSNYNSNFLNVDLIFLIQVFKACCVKETVYCNKFYTKVFIKDQIRHL